MTAIAILMQSVLHNIVTLTMFVQIPAHLTKEPVLMISDATAHKILTVFQVHAMSMSALQTVLDLHMTLDATARLKINALQDTVHLIALAKIPAMRLKVRDLIQLVALAALALIVIQEPVILEILILASLIVKLVLILDHLR
mmetsp:Transcript_21745/g.16074  ORF Transcript_21745/g.16074 Transcript_21745/m.16074 type:complete len:142 (-) Transcript_21745:3793-4218(-)